MIAYTPEALRQIDQLLLHYGSLARSEAIRNLGIALETAAVRILGNPTHGLPAPRPYPSLARHGQAWIREGRYWIAYSLSTPPVIVGVFFEAADIPSRG